MGAEQPIKGNEGILRGVRLLAVSELDPGEFLISYTAEEGEWLAPGDPLSGPDGVLRGLHEVQGSMHMNFYVEEEALQASRQLSQWVMEQTSLLAFSSLQRGAMGLIDPLGQRAVAIELSQQESESPD